MKRTNPKTMKTSPEGQVELAVSEGVVPAVYKDTENVDTYGIGVTKWAIGSDQMASLPRAMPDDIDAAVDLIFDLFLRVIVQYEDAVRKAVNVPLYQHEFDALVHFTYNVGEPNLNKSRLLKNLNAGNYTQAGKSGFHGWLKQTELRGRRDTESKLFLRGEYGSDPIPVYKTNGAGRLGARIDSIPRSTALQMIRNEGRFATSQPVISVPQVSAVSSSEPPRVSPFIESTTITAQLQQWATSLAPLGVGVWSALQQQDPTTRAVILGVLGVASIYMLHLGRHIIKERLRKWSAGDR